MLDLEEAPRAVVVLVVGERDVVLGAVERGTRCDLALVERLLRLRLAARRLGWSLRLLDVDAELRALIELVGVSQVLSP